MSNSEQQSDGQSGTAIPRTVDQLKRRLEDGECWMWEYYDHRMYFEFIDEVGWIRTRTDHRDRDPHTTAATEDELKTAIGWGHLEQVDPSEVPKSAK